MTFATEAAKQAQDWVAIIKIEGVGEWLSTTDRDATDGDGQTLFCTGIPSGETAAVKALSIWKPYLAEFPDVLSESTSVMGGTTSAGGIEFGIVDVDDFLTEKLRTDSVPVTLLAADINSTSTAPSFEDTGNIGTEVLFVGGEAWRWDTGSTWHRGWLGTDGQEHKTGDRVSVYTPAIRGRRALLYLCPADGTLADKQLFGEYVLGPMSWDEPLNTWRFSGRSQRKYLDRLVPRKQPYTYSIHQTFLRGGTESNRAIVLDYRSKDWLSPTALWVDLTSSDGSLFLRAVGSKEVMRAEHLGGDTDNNTLEVYKRDALNIGVVEELKPGMKIKQVFVANEDGLAGSSSFRYSPGPSPATSMGAGTTWVDTAHWLDIIACIMMSPADATDGIDISTNYDSGAGNYCILPTGYGLGMSQSVINWTEFRDVRERTSDFLFDRFVYGDKVTTFANLVDEAFLKPIGAYFRSVAGALRIILPRVPDGASAAVTLGSDDILTREVGPRNHLPRMSVSQNREKVVNSVIYELGDGDVDIYTNSEFEGLYGQRSHYASIDQPQRYRLEGYNNETRDWAHEPAMARLFRFHKPTFDVEMDVGIDKYTLEPGDVFKMSVDEVPNLKTAARGWTNILMEVLETELKFGDEGAYIHMKCTGYGPAAKVGRIGPSAEIVAIVTNTVEFQANVFTDPNDVNGVTKDVLAFAVGDVCNVFERDGEKLATTATVVSIDDANNKITFDGNFGGGVAATKYIAYADYDDATATQTAGYVYLADLDGDFDIATSGDEPWVYGDR